MRRDKFSIGIFKGDAFRALALLERVRDELARSPGLVHADDTGQLCALLAQVVGRRRCVIQASQRLYRGFGGTHSRPREGPGRPARRTASRYGQRTRPQPCRPDDQPHPTGGRPRLSRAARSRLGERGPGQPYEVVGTSHEALLLDYKLPLIQTIATREALASVLRPWSRRAYPPTRPRPGAAGGIDRRTRTVTSSTDVEQLVVDVERGLGPVAFLVNNARILRAVTALEATEQEQDWEQTLAANAGGVFRLSTAVARRMTKHGSGAIVTVASNAASVPRAHMAAYGASRPRPWRSPRPSPWN